MTYRKPFSGSSLFVLMLLFVTISNNLFSDFLFPQMLILLLDFCSLTEV